MKVKDLVDLPKKKEVHPYDIENCFVNSYENRGYNQALSDVSSLPISKDKVIGMVIFDREKLAGECYKLRCKINGGKAFVEWEIICKDKAHPAYWICLEDADDIIVKSDILTIKGDIDAVR